ncbi:ABC transporter substrate-binding protein [Streptomyces sp. AM 2-1-1]|uniref:ABC transporter substrate-binding protein n=1 Tax=Streptomyces sp. AM 2-1-1 TaxID=3028709 RepID=UPI0023B9C1E0|nr:ABC transporter substrate-binding protein [Streptomyces sp. AM 2-1-1]WEH43476.1 ABC transporter substrate-binding protein [Streptomyces sp. AM 2-1-1]
MADLAGRSFCGRVTRAARASTCCSKALAKAGIPADEGRGVYLQPDQTAAVFNAGQVDAWAVWATYAVAEIGSGKAHFVADGAALGSDNYSLNAVRTEFAEQHPKVLKALYQYLHEASAKEKRNPAAYLNVFADARPDRRDGEGQGGPDAVPGTGRHHRPHRP